MKALFCILFISSASFLFAQKQSPDLKLVSESIQSYFNAGDYNAIFSMLTDDFQKSQGRRRVVATFKGLKEKYGEIKKMSPVNSHSSLSADYKVEHENGEEAPNWDKQKGVIILSNVSSQHPNAIGFDGLSQQIMMASD